MSRVYRHRAPLWIYILSIGAFTASACLAIVVALGYTIDPANLSIYKTGLMVVRSEPSGADITIDGNPLGETTPERFSLRAGKHTVRVTKADTKPYEKSVAVAPGQAVFLEDILLWRATPTVTDVATTVQAVAISGNRRQFAYVKPSGDGTAIYVASLGNPSVLLATIPASYAAPTAFAFSTDGTALLVANATETTLLPLGGSSSRVSTGGSVSFIPGRGDTLLLAQPGRLSFLTRTAAPQLLFEGVTSFAATKEALYVATNDGTVVRYDPKSGNRRAVASGVGAVTLSPAGLTDAVYALKADRSLLLISPQASEGTVVSSNVSSFGASDDNLFLAYATETDLRLRDMKSNQDSLVTRSSRGLQAPQPFSGGTYVLYESDGQLQSVAKDGSHGVSLLPSGTVTEVLQKDTILRLRDGALELHQIVNR